MNRKAYLGERWLGPHDCLLVPSLNQVQVIKCLVTREADTYSSHPTEFYHQSDEVRMHALMVQLVVTCRGKIHCNMSTTSSAPWTTSITNTVYHTFFHSHCPGFDQWKPMGFQRLPSAGPKSSRTGPLYGPGRPFQQICSVLLEHTPHGMRFDLGSVLGRQKEPGI